MVDRVYILAPGPTLALIPHGRRIFDGKFTIVINSAIEVYYDPVLWIIGDSIFYEHYVEQKCYAATPLISTSEHICTVVPAIKIAARINPDKIILFGVDFINLREKPAGCYPELGDDYYSTGINWPVSKFCQNQLAQAQRNFRNIFKIEGIQKKLFSPSKFLCSQVPVNYLCMDKCF